MSAMEPGYQWSGSLDGVDWTDLSELYRVAPLGDKSPQYLETVFTNSMFRIFVSRDGRLLGAGRALADGLDCAYIADVAVHPEHQGMGIGRAIVSKLVSLASGHKKVLLYANPGREGFYASLGFLPMTTAMAIWADTQTAIANGLLAPVER